MSVEFKNLSLHDSILKEIEYAWSSKELIITGELFGAAKQSFKIFFNGVTNICIPHKEKWGPSTSINELSGASGVYSINMQSGDAITIEASNFSYALKNT